MSSSWCRSATPPTLGQLGLGGGDAGWSPADHTVIARWLFETLGVVPLMVGVDRVGYTGSVTAHARSDAQVIASRLNQYCSDAVGEDDVEPLREALTEVRGIDLRLWWD